MIASPEVHSVIVGERRTVTIVGIFNERTGFFDLKPMFVGSQPPTVITDRLEEIRKRANVTACEDQFRRDAQEYWLIAEREFDTHTLHVVATNFVYGAKVFMLPMDIVCQDGAIWDGAYVFAGNIPYLGRVDIIDFYRDWQHLYHFEIPRSIPRIVLYWHPESAPSQGRHTIAWEGRHDERRTLFYYLAYESAKGIREPLTLLSEVNEVEVDFSSLPSGVGRLVLTASDGYNTVETYSQRFYVPSRPCTAFIFSPEDEAVISGGLVNLSGHGFYDDGKTAETDALEWVSDRDGTIGQGALVTSAVLSPGRHQISLIAGLPGVQSTASIQIEVLPTDS